MAYYGFEHSYGSNVRDNNGDLIGVLHVFPNRTARDSWLDAGGDYRNEPGARTAIKSLYAARIKRRSTNAESH
jgi:hypothetical protein